MNGALRTATLVPLTGLLPLGLAILASFMRFVPVLARVGEGPGRATGMGR